MKKYLITAFTVALTLSSCQNKKDDSSQEKQFPLLEKAAWLEGNWENNSPQGILSESWIRENDSVFTGNAFFIKGKDTLHKESIVLSEQRDQLVYTPSVEGQNSGKPVPFRMTVATEKQLIFENTAHDYPQKISYTKINNDSLVAEISGKQQGKVSVEKYPMGRIK